MLRWIICKTIIGKPEISIDEHFTVGFEPSRAVWQLQVMNKKITGLQRWFFCKRETVEDCCIEADFMIENKQPRFAEWSDFTLRPNSYHIL